MTSKSKGQRLTTTQGRTTSNQRISPFVIRNSRTFRNPPVALAGAVELEGGSDFQNGGRLQKFAKVWLQKHAHPRVVDLLTHGYQLDFKFRPNLSRIPLILSKYANPAKQICLQQAVTDMLNKDAITLVRNSTTLGFYSRLFLVPKQNNKWRPVIDLSLINCHLNVPTFKMETAESIRNSLRKNEWLVSIDLRDAYFHIPIHPRSQKYLRFQTKEGVFQFKALPFGIATAPLEFTRVVKEVKIMAMNENLRIHQYLDDWLLRSNSKQQCIRDSENLIHLIQELGWLINFKKSQLTPTQNLDFLGYHFDLEKGLVFPTRKKLDLLAQQIVSIRKSFVTTPRKLMSFIGTLASLEKTIPMSRIQIRPFQWYLKNHWKFPQSLDLKIPVKISLLKHLRWWEDQLNLMKGAPLHPTEHNVLIFTDASQKGWGAHLGNLSLSGLWKPQETNLHINLLELKAVVLALKGFQDHIVEEKVLICSDNSTVVSYINKEGGTHSLGMCALTWRLMAWTNARRIQIKARHVPGSLNVIADSLSRRDNVIQTEWSLHKQIFHKICTTWHKPTVDLFATRLNFKIQTYVSPVPDQRAWAVDALSISWEGLDGYIYCPVALIPQVVLKMITYPCRMIVIAPGWPGMSWFWDLVDLSTNIPMCLPIWENLLKQSHSNRFHKNIVYLNLHVWHLDSRSRNLEDSLLKWQRELRFHRENLPEKFTIQGGPFLGNGPSRIRWKSPLHLFQT